MKKDSFEQQLRNRMEGYEVAPPDDLWAQIEQEAGLTMTEPVSTTTKEKERKARVWPLWMRSAAAAAVLLLMGGGALWLMKDTMHEMTVEKNAGVAAIADATGAHKEDAQQRQDAAESVERNATTTTVSTYVPTASEPLLLAKAETPSPPHETEMMVSRMAETDNQSQQIVGEESDALKEKAQQQDAYMKDAQRRSSRPMRSSTVSRTSTTNRKVSNSNLTVELYANNNMNGQYSNVSPVKASPSQLMAMNVGNSYMSGQSMGAKQSGPVFLSDYSEKTKHYMPVRFGLSVGYRLGERWGLKTGVNYQRLRTDFIQNIEQQTIVTEKSYHYVGIPLAVTYDLYASRRLKVYGKAGGEADFNVKARQVMHGMESDLTKDRLQLSAEAGLGVQVNCVPHVSVFVEPGAAYYFDNGSATRTIFKDKPLSIDLQLGVRIDVR